MPVLRLCVKLYYTLLHSCFNVTQSWYKGHIYQCRNKGYITMGGGGGGTWAPEVQAGRGVWGHAPPENFES